MTRATATGSRGFRRGDERTRRKWSSRSNIDANGQLASGAPVDFGDGHAPILRHAVHENAGGEGPEREPPTVPPVLDHPEWDLAMWGDEFLARFCPNASRIDLRTGAVASCVTEWGKADGDLIVLSWSQDASPGHAAVIREVLARAAVPVLLLPVDAAGTIGADAPVSGRRR